ncbi:hypothetical protein ABPG75_010824 [Micractinium tetrahymenae]
MRHCLLAAAAAAMFVCQLCIYVLPATRGAAPRSCPLATFPRCLSLLPLLLVGLVPLDPPLCCPVCPAAGGRPGPFAPCLLPAPALLLSLLFLAHWTLLML